MLALRLELIIHRRQGRRSEVASTTVMNSRKFIKQLSLYCLPLVLFAMATSVFAKQYYIYGDKKNGTKFREKLYTWDVPLSRAYEKLSNQHKLIVRGNYPDLAPEDTPPYPRKGMKAILEPYVEEFRWFAGFSGGQISALVDEKGRVIRVNGSSGMHAIVVDYLKTLLRSTQFDPATCEGKPCAKEFHLTLRSIQNPKREDYL